MTAKSDAGSDEHRDVLAETSRHHDRHDDEVDMLPSAKRLKHEAEKDSHDEPSRQAVATEKTHEPDGRESPDSPQPNHINAGHPSNHGHVATNHVPNSVNIPQRGVIYHFPACTSNVPCVRMHKAAAMNSLRMNHTSHNGGFYPHLGLPMPTPAGLPTLPPPSVHPPSPLSPVKSIELLQRLFPEQNRHVLELILQACDGDIVQTIECILPTHERSRRGPKGQPSCTCQDIDCIYNRAHQERSGSAFSPIGVPRIGLHAKPNGGSLHGNLKIGEICREPPRQTRAVASLPPDSDTIPPVYIVNTSPSDSPDSRVSSEEPGEASENRTKLCQSCGRRSSNLDNFCSCCGKKL